MSEQHHLLPGQIWRRIKDGTLVRVYRVYRDRKGYAVDVIWTPPNARRSPLRACNPWTFRDRYEWVSDTSEPS